MKTEFLPGTLGFHELVDRTCLIAETFSSFVAGHPSRKVTRKITKRIKRIEAELFDLYSELSTMHCSVPGSPSKVT